MPQGAPPPVFGVSSGVLSSLQSKRVPTPAGTPLYVLPDMTLAAAKGDTALHAACAGFLRQAAVAGEVVSIQSSGYLSLTTDQWDAVVAGESGGLTPGQTYYLSGSVGGQLINTPTAGFVTAVGIAISASTMLVLLVPIVEAGGGGGTVITDEVTIGGVGSLADPIHAIFTGFYDNVAVAVDGTTIGGDGLSGDPLTVIPAGLYDKIEVATDGTTIGGTGLASSALRVIGGPGSPETFTYTVTGAEPDLANIAITFGTPRGDDLYNVFAAMQGGTNFYGVPQIKSKTDDGFTLALSANAVAGDVWAFYVADVF